MSGPGQAVDGQAESHQQSNPRDQPSWVVESHGPRPQKLTVAVTVSV